MSFQDLAEFLETDLKLPVKGKTYAIPSPTMEVGVWCTNLLETAAKAHGLAEGEKLPDADVDALQLDDDEERDFYRRILGPAYDELLADKVEWVYVQFIGQTVFFWITSDRKRAEDFWKSGGRSGKAPKAPTDRKASEKSGRQASPATTKSPRKKPASRGGASSSTGT